MSKQVANGYAFEWCLLEAYRRQGVDVIHNDKREETLLKKVEEAPKVVEQSTPIATALVKKLLELEPKTISVTAVGGTHLADLRCGRDGKTSFDISAKHGSIEVYGPRFNLNGLHQLPVRGGIPSDQLYVDEIKRLQEEICVLGRRFQTWTDMDAEDQKIKFDLLVRFRDLLGDAFRRLDVQHVPRILVGALGSDACYIVTSENKGQFGTISSLNFDGSLSHGKKLSAPKEITHIDNVKGSKYSVDLTLMPGHWALRFRVHTKSSKVCRDSVSVSVSLEGNPNKNGSIDVRP